MAATFPALKPMCTADAETRRTICRPFEREEHIMSGKHARSARPGPAGATGRSAGRRLAAGAIILAAGATPLVAAAGAQAASPIDLLGAATGATGALPALGSLPLSLNPAAASAGQVAPLDSVLPAAQSMQMLDNALPLSEVAPINIGPRPISPSADGPADGVQAAQTRSAPLPDTANPQAAPGSLGPLGSVSSVGSPSPAGLSMLAQSSLTAVTDPTSNTLGTVGQSVPGGGVGALTSGFTPQADTLTGSALQQTNPVVGRLQQRGVPTVGNLTNKLGESSVPMVGPVGHLTRTLPLSTVLGTANPLADTLSTATQL
jgi:hypothetical protein